MKRKFHEESTSDTEDRPPAKKQRQCVVGSNDENSKENSDSKSNQNPNVSSNSNASVKSRKVKFTVLKDPIKSSKHRIWYPLFNPDHLGKQKHKYGGRCDREYKKLETIWDKYETSMKKAQHQDVFNGIWNTMKKCSKIEMFKAYWDECEYRWQIKKRKGQSSVDSFFSKSSKKNKNKNNNIDDSKIAKEDEEKRIELPKNSERQGCEKEKEKDKEKEKEKEKEKIRLKY